MSGFIKKIWKDRVTEFPTRRSLTKQDGSVELVTVAREEGTVSQEGDAFSAQNMNDLEERVKTAFDAVDSSLTVLGNCDLLAQATSQSSSNEVTTKDISQYRYLYLTLQNGTTELKATSIIPVEIYKICGWFNNQFDSSSASYAKYISDTKSILYKCGSVTNAYLYGIK